MPGQKSQGGCYVLSLLRSILHRNCSNRKSKTSFISNGYVSGHVSEISAAGDYVTFDLIDKPLLIVRDKDNNVRAYSNVCRHRSTVLATGAGNRSAFSCPYHAWTYDLSGCLRSAPHMDKDKVAGICLPEYPVEIWQGLIFVSVNPDVEPLSPRLEALAERMSAL